MATLLDSYTLASADGWIGLGASGDAPSAGQSFTPGSTLPIHSIKIRGHRTSTDVAGDVVCYIYAHTGTYGTGGLPTGSILATSDTFNANTLAVGDFDTGDFTDITFTFSGAERIELTSGTRYFFIVEYDGGNPYVLFGLDGSSPGHGGNFVFWNGSAYEADNGADAVFEVYGEATSGTAHNETYTEALVLADTINKSTSRTLTDVATLVDTVNKATSRTLTDVAILVDTLTKNPGKVLTDVATLVDTKIVSMARTLTDVITPVDTVPKSTSRTLEDNFSITDTITRSISRVLTDTATLVDSILTSAGEMYELVLTETIRLKDWVWQMLRKATTFTKQTPTSASFTKETPDSATWTKEDPPGN